MSTHNENLAQNLGANSNLKPNLNPNSNSSPKALPKTWQKLPFSQCVDKVSIKYKIKQKEYLENGKYPIIDQGQNFISGYCDDEIAIKLQKPVVVFGDHTRCFKFVNFDFVAGADGIQILQPKDFFEPKLFYYFCLNLDFPNKGYSRHYQYLSKSEMNLPPTMEIQRQIVQRLDAAFEKIDKAVARLKSAKSNLTRYKQSLLKAAFNGTLTKSPHATWQSKTLGEVAKVVTGKTPSKAHKEYFGGKIPFVKPSDLDKEMFIDTSEDTLTEAGFEKAPFIPKNSVLVSCIGNLGKKAILTIDGSCNQQINAIIPNENLDYKFIYYQIDIMKFWMAENASATTVTILNKGKFEKAPVILPPLQTQKEIVQILERHFEGADKTEKFIDSALNRAKMLKQSLLKAAFEGTLVQ